MAAITKGIIGRTSKKASKNGDCKNALGKRKRISSSILEIKALEKIGLKKGSIKKSREITEPIRRVLHEYFRICSIEVMLA